MNRKRAHEASEAYGGQQTSRRGRYPWATPLAVVCLAACGAAAEGSDTASVRKDDPIETTAASLTAPTEDGLADAYSTFLGVFVPPQGNFDSQFPIGFGFHEGLVTEKVAANGITARGSAVLDMNRGTVSATLNDVPTNGQFDLWLVKNVTGGTVAPEATDQMLKVGTFAGTGSSRTLSASLGSNILFDLDLVVVTRSGKTPDKSCVAIGDRTLFEKRLFRFRMGKTLDPVTGPLANDIETTDPLVARGAQIFFNETFGGNGRTCGTCHRAERSLTIDPAFIATLPQSDPLFVGETHPALAQLEDPVLLRSQALFRINNHGFDDPTHEFVERGVPHTLSLGLTNGIANQRFGPPDARLGWSGDGGPGRGTLHEFSFGAIIQHFTKTLNRKPGVDFRIPTEEELDALEAFQLFTGRQTISDFQPSTVTPTDPRAANGSNLFFNVGCSTFCHTDMSGFVDANGNFNTGVVNLAPNLPRDDGFSGTGTGDDTFNIPPLVEAADTPPHFHNNAAATIEDAVAFYSSATFQASPSSVFINTPLDTAGQADVAAFLRVVNSFANLAQVRKRAVYIQNVRSPGNSDLLNTAVADTGDALADLSAKSLNPSVQTQISAIEALLQTALATADAKRPPIMAKVVKQIDAASGALLTAPAP
jgi:cytochrome c peroxidase